MTVRTHPLLFSPIDVHQREPLMADYHRFLQARNGPRVAPGTFQRREESVQRMNRSPVRANEPIDQATFDQKKLEILQLGPPPPAASADYDEI